MPKGNDNVSMNIVYVYQIDTHFGHPSKVDTVHKVSMAAKMSSK